MSSKISTTKSLQPEAETNTRVFGVYPQVRGLAKRRTSLGQRPSLSITCQNVVALTRRNVVDMTPSLGYTIL